jgi:hypothetical protein
MRTGSFSRIYADSGKSRQKREVTKHMLPPEDIETILTTHDLSVYLTGEGTG